MFSAGYGKVSGGWLKMVAAWADCLRPGNVLDAREAIFDQDEDTRLDSKDDDGNHQ